MLVETLEGQAVELGWIRDNDCGVGTENYLKLILKKTAWYSFIHPVRIGARIVGAGSELDRFNRFGYLIGAAFQIQDDLLSLIGAESQYGKEIGGDLSEGKRTLVLSHALSHAAPTDRARLEQFLSRPGRARLAREVLVVMDILRQTGAIEWTRSARELADAAVKELRTSSMERGTVRTWTSFIRWSGSSSSGTSERSDARRRAERVVARNPPGQGPHISEERGPGVGRTPSQGAVQAAERPRAPELDEAAGDLGKRRAAVQHPGDEGHAAAGAVRVLIGRFGRVHVVGHAILRPLGGGGEVCQGVVANRRRTPPRQCLTGADAA